MVKTLLEAGVTSAAATAAVACTGSPYIALEVPISSKCDGLQDNLSSFELFKEVKITMQTKNSKP